MGLDDYHYKAAV
jgi:hypothetical protein